MKNINAKDLKEVSHTLTILFAEDEEILRDSMKLTLEKFFQKVLVASNGQEAFELYKKEKVDIVLTDINMPIMKGTELISCIHEMDDDPVIIVLSAHNESRLLQTLINMDVNNFLNKPVEKTSLMKILYKNCEIIENKNLLQHYAKKLEEDYMAIARKNIILEQKYNQIASQTNAIEKAKAQKNNSNNTEKKAEIENYFATLIKEDRDELRDLSEELDTYIMLMFQNEGFNTNYIQKIAYIYQRYSSILNSYTEFYALSGSLRELSEVITDLEEKFLKDISQTGVYFESLQMSLETFRQNIWEKEASDPYFYNASLKNDVQFVIDFLQDNETQDSEIEFF